MNQNVIVFTKAGVIFKTLTNFQDKCPDQSELTLVLHKGQVLESPCWGRWPVLELRDLGEVSEVEEGRGSGGRGHWRAQGMPDAQI